MLYVQHHANMKRWVLKKWQVQEVERRQRRVQWPAKIGARGGTPILSQTYKMKARDDRLFIESGLAIYLFQGLFDDSAMNKLWQELFACLRALWTMDTQENFIQEWKGRTTRVLEDYKKLFPANERFVLLHAALEHGWDFLAECGPAITAFGPEKMLGWMLR